MKVEIKPSFKNVPHYITRLEQLRNQLHPVEWKEYATHSREVLEWRCYLCQDPFTRWGLLKPRGFAGDARLMDFAYRHPSVKRDLKRAGSYGRTLYDITSSAKQHTSLTAGLRYLSRYLNHLIQERADSAPGFKIASYASGHGRELEQLELETLRRIDSFCAIDTDGEALNEIKTYGDLFHVETIQEDVFTFERTHNKVDVVYAFGIFESLTIKQSQVLLARMLTSLKPGGQVLIANLDHGAEKLAYYEAMMDWWIFTKSFEDVHKIGEGLEPGLIKECRCFRQDCFNYLHAWKT